MPERGLDHGDGNRDLIGRTRPFGELGEHGFRLAPTSGQRVRDAVAVSLPPSAADQRLPFVEDRDRVVEPPIAIHTSARRA